MNFLSYSLTALISFLGLVAGIIIMLMAKEEQRPGKKYFILLQKLILLLIIIFLLYFIKFNLIIFITLFLIVIALYIKKYKNKKIIESYYIYPLLGVIFWLSSKNKSSLFIQSSLIFLYGLTSASLLVKKNNILKLIINHASFIIVALILFLI